MQQQLAVSCKPAIMFKAGQHILQLGNVHLEILCPRIIKCLSCKTVGTVPTLVHTPELIRPIVSSFTVAVSSIQKLHVIACCGCKHESAATEKHRLQH